jgi:hypothetical protein
MRDFELYQAAETKNVFDKFHVIKHLQEAGDLVRKSGHRMLQQVNWNQVPLAHAQEGDDSRATDNLRLLQRTEAEVGS